MIKTVRKLQPSDLWRIGEHESWFADMAAKGLHLRKVGILFAKFVKGEPKNMRYRLDVSMKRKITPEQIQLYSESGWDYVTSYNFFHVFSSPEERNAPELHSDPAEQSFTLQDLEQRFTISAVIVVVATMLMLAMYSAFWFLDGTPTLALMEGDGVQQIFITIFLTYMAYHSLRAAISIRTLRRNLLEGKPINHKAPWQKHYRLQSTIAFLIILVAGFSAIIPFIQLIKMDTTTLPETSSDLPIVRLADIEDNPALVRGEPYYMEDNVDWTNSYSYEWSPIAPVQYESHERGVVPDKMWADGSGEYSPSVYTQLFHLSLPVLADHLLSDLIEKNQFDPGEKNRVIEHPDFDQLIVSVEEEMKKVYSTKGKTVMFIRYHGYADVSSVIESMVEKMALLSN